MNAVRVSRTSLDSVSVNNYEVDLRRPMVSMQHDRLDWLRSGLSVAKLFPTEQVAYPLQSLQV